MRYRVRQDWHPRKPGRTHHQLSPRVGRMGYHHEPSRRWMIVKDFISENERIALLHKASGHLRRGELAPNPCGPCRFYAKADDEPAVYIDALLEQLTRRCERCLRLDGVPADRILGRIISLIQPSGFIHRHTDAYDHGIPGSRPERHHLRCNIVVSLQHPSGRPVIEGEALEVSERDLWVFTASRFMHQTEPLQGSSPRVVYGFGWSVAADHELQPPPDVDVVGSAEHDASAQHVASPRRS